MRIQLRIGSKSIELGKFTGDGAGASFRDPSSAERFLRQFRGDPGAMTKLRQLASQLFSRELNRSSDDQVIRSLAGALTSGRIQLGGLRQKDARSGPQEAPSDSAPAPAPAASAAPAPPPPSEPSTFGRDFDAAAQAAVLQQAANDGVPFCEECERRRRERAA